MSATWLICDMDDGVLRRVASFREAKAWFSGWQDVHPSRLRVHRYTAGYYEISGGDGSFVYSVGVVRSDAPHGTGWDAGQVPLYPSDEYPWERVERDAQDSLDKDSLGGAGAFVMTLPVRPGESMPSEDELVRDLRAAHADQERLDAELAAARQRRREAAAGLRGLGKSMNWIAGQIGVTQQAVDGFLKYKERRSRAG